MEKLGTQNLSEIFDEINICFLKTWTLYKIWTFFKKDFWKCGHVLNIQKNFRKYVSSLQTLFTMFKHIAKTRIVFEFGKTNVEIFGKGWKNKIKNVNNF